MDFFNSPFHFRSKFTPNSPKIHSNPALESSRIPLIILDCEPHPLQLELPLSSHAALLFCTVVPFHLHPAGHVGVHRHAEFLGCLGEKTQKTQKNATARIQDVSNVFKLGKKIGEAQDPKVLKLWSHISGTKLFGFGSPLHTSEGDVSPYYIPYMFDERTVCRT